MFVPSCCSKVSYMFLPNGVSTSSIAVKAEILLPSTGLLSNCQTHHMARQLEGGQVKIIGICLEKMNKIAKLRLLFSNLQKGRLLFITTTTTNTNDHPSGLASCERSSGWIGLLQMIIRMDRPLANDHPEGRPLANDHREGPASCKYLHRINPNQCKCFPPAQVSDSPSPS